MQRKGLLLFSVIFVLMVSSVSAQRINIGSWVSPSSAPKIDPDQYIFVDFWATWCGPCIAAMEHISELKEVSENKVVYISISNEHPDVISKFVSKRNFASWIVYDYNGESFKNFGIESLPHSILIAPDRNVIWKGRPGDMSFVKLKDLISKKDYKWISANKKIKTWSDKREYIATQQIKYFREQNMLAAYK